MILYLSKVFLHNSALVTKVFQTLMIGMYPHVSKDNNYPDKIGYFMRLIYLGLELMHGILSSVIDI